MFLIINNQTINVIFLQKSFRIYHLTTLKIQFKTKANKMKFIFKLCFLISIPLSIQAQGIWEHTYPTTDLHRVKWSFGGEHYWFSNDSLKQVKIYSSQHQLLKTIQYPLVLNSQVRLLKSEHGVTQTHLNGDNLLEMIWIFKDTMTKKEPYKLQIRNERDSVIFTVNTLAHLVYFSEIEGLPTKLLIATWENGRNPNTFGYRTTVYNVPNIQVDTIYYDAYYLHRKKFGYSGEKYFYIYKDSMKLFNANHSWWKTVNLKWSRNIQVDNSNSIYTDADDNVFSKDTLVEIVFSYDVTGNKGHLVINELGKKIYKSNYNFRLDHQKGLKDKLFIDTIIDNTFPSYFRIYSLSSFKEELKDKKTSYPWQRTLLKKYGEVNYTYDGRLVLYYNSNLTRKSIDLQNTLDVHYPSSIFFQNDVPILSDTILNRDSFIEVIYAQYKYANNKREYTTKIINETGTIYNTIDSTRYFTINHIEGLPNKLITKTGNDTPYDTKVWRFNITTAIKEAPPVLDVQIYPNPFAQSFTIEVMENSVFPSSLRLTNSLGQTVLTTKMNESKIVLALPNLANGIYWLEIMNENKQTIRKIVKTAD